MSARRFVSFFDGAGMFSLGLHRAGWECVGACEIEPFARKVRTARLGAPAWYPTDIREVREVPRSELWVAGFPCQDLSVSGRRCGINGERSGLVWKLLDLAREAKARGELPDILLENVSGLLSGSDAEEDDEVDSDPSGWGVEKSAARVDWMGALLGEMADIWDRVAWRVLDARYWGVAQRRRRVFLVGCSGGRDPGAVLFEPEGSARNSPSRGKTRTRSAGGAARGAGVGSIASALTNSDGHHGRRSPRRDGSDNLVIGAIAAGRDAALDLRLRNEQREADELRLRDGSTVGVGGGQRLPPVEVAASIQGGGKRGHRIDAEGAAGGHLVPVAAQCHGSNVGPMGTLRATDNVTSGVPFVVALRGREEGSRAEVSEIVPALRTPGGGSSHPLIVEGDSAASTPELPRLRAGCGRAGETFIAFDPKQSGQDAGELAPTLRAGGHKDSHANGGIAPAVAFALPGNGPVGRNARETEVAGPLGTKPGEQSSDATVVVPVGLDSDRESARANGPARTAA